MTSIVLAFAAAFLFGLALVLAQVGLRYVAPLSGAAIAIPSSTALFICVAPFALADATPVWAAVPIFAAIGLTFPGTVTLLTFAANRALGPVMTGTLGNLAPLFAVALASAGDGRGQHAAVRQGRGRAAACARRRAHRGGRRAADRRLGRALARRFQSLAT